MRDAFERGTLRHGWSGDNAAGGEENQRRKGRARQSRSGFRHTG
jgi:hypothetical protein